MKSVLSMILLVVLTITLNAQPKQAPKPVTTTTAPGGPTKPRGPVPYAMKKDVDDALAGMNVQIKGISVSTSGLRGLIMAKDASINRLSNQMSKVEEILNSTAFKVATTSDSLDQTRFSIEEFRNNILNSFYI